MHRPAYAEKSVAYRNAAEQSVGRKPAGRFIGGLDDPQPDDEGRNVDIPEDVLRGAAEDHP